ncbi:hypothetical protein IWQ57_003170, partial [Coemansia nantahalensis]
RALLKILHAISDNPYPSGELVQQIVREHGLARRQVLNWFALRRHRHMVRAEIQGVPTWRFRSEVL